MRETVARPADAADRWALRVGGIAALAIGVTYIAIVVMYSVTGAPPSGGAAWLTYGVGKTTAWWGILGLSVLTDLLFVPAALALYLALRTVNRGAMLLGTALIGLFVVLDLAVTWPNYASLITLTGDFAAATTDVQRAALITAATYPAAVLGSSLFPVYVILVPAAGVFIASLVMLQGHFSRGAALVGVVTGVAGTVTVIGPWFWSPLDAAVVLTSVLTTAWVVLTGYRLFRLGWG